MASKGLYTMRPVIPQTRCDTGSRITIKNIPAGITEAQLKANLSKHGDVRIHMYSPGTQYGLGWAWVSCEKHDDVEKMLACAEHRKAQAAAALREDMTVKPTDKQQEDAATATETSADEAKNNEPESASD